MLEKHFNKSLFDSLISGTFLVNIIASIQYYWAVVLIGINRKKNEKHLEEFFFAKG